MTNKKGHPIEYLVVGMIFFFLFAGYGSDIIEKRETWSIEINHAKWLIGFCVFLLVGSWLTRD